LPTATAVTVPKIGSIVATAVLLLLHEPPETPSDRVVVPPVVRLEVPVIVPAFGAGLTVTVAVALPQAVV
jgi:hypothetical protein